MNSHQLSLISLLILSCSVSFSAPLNRFASQNVDKEKIRIEQITKGMEKLIVAKQKNIKFYKPGEQVDGWESPNLEEVKNTDKAQEVTAQCTHDTLFAKYPDSDIVCEITFLLPGQMCNTDYYLYRISFSTAEAQVEAGMETSLLRKFAVKKDRMVSLDCFNGAPGEEPMHSHPSSE